MTLQLGCESASTQTPASGSATEETMTHGDVDHELDRLERTFDTPKAAADAGAPLEHAAPRPNRAHERHKTPTPPATTRVHRQS